MGPIDLMCMLDVIKAATPNDEESGKVKVR